MFDLSFLAAMRKLKINQFDGGITDNVDTADINQSKTLDNLHWTPNGRMLFQRGGQKLHDTSYPRITSNDDVDAIFELEGFYFYVSGRNIYYKSKTAPSGFTVLSGPSNLHAALPAAGRPNITFWKGHAIITVDVDGVTYKSARKIYVDQTGTPRVRTAGLPKVFTEDGGTWQLGKAAATVNGVDIRAYQTDYAYKFAASYRYEYQVKVNGIAYSFIDFGPACISNTIYTSVALDYASGKRLTLSWLALNNTDDRAGHGWFEECWDITNMDLDWFIYDSTLEKFITTTSSGNPVHQRIPDTFGTTTPTSLDSYGYGASSTYSDYRILYIADNSLSKDPPPCSLYHMTGPDNVTWYINNKDAPNRARQSVQDDGDSAPESVYVSAPYPLTGGGYFGLTPLIFTKFSGHRIDGIVNSKGQGSSLLRTIEGAEGCIAHRGIVSTPWGLIYPSTSGFCFTNGFQSWNLSRKNLPDRYLNWTDDTTKTDLLQGVFWPRMKLALWTVSTDGTSVTDIVALDLSRGIEREGRFRTFSGFEGLISLSVMDDELYWGDDAGYVYQWDETRKNDVKRSIGTAVGSWVNKPIYWTWVTPSYDFGDADTEKYLNVLELEHRYANSLGIGISCTSDNNSEGFKDLEGHEYEDLTPQTYYPTMTVGDPVPVIGSGDPAINHKPNVKVKRNIPLREQRCNRKSFKFNNLYRVQYLSANYANSTYDILSTDPAKFKATISSGSWPADVVGMYIAFSSEDYKVKHEITARPSGTVLELEVLDASATPELRTNQSWKIYYVADDERPYLMSLGVTYLQESSDRSGTYMADS